MYISFSLIIALVAVVGSYVYFVNNTIVAIAEAHDLNDGIAEMQSEMTHLEKTYLEKQDALSVEFAYNKGFVTGSEKVYVKRDTITTASLYGRSIQE